TGRHRHRAPLGGHGSLDHGDERGLLPRHPRGGAVPRGARSGGRGHDGRWLMGRRVGVYFCWSQHRENVPLAVLEHRYPALFEFRRLIWPSYEQARDPARYRQDVSGFLDHVVLSDFQRMLTVAQEATGVAPVLRQREAYGEARHELDDEWLGSLDSLVLVSL